MDRGICGDMIIGFALSSLLQTIVIDVVIKLLLWRSMKIWSIPCMVDLCA